METKKNYKYQSFKATIWKYVKLINDGSIKKGSENIQDVSMMMYRDLVN